MRYGYWLPVFGGWLRNIPDEKMPATWSFVKQLAQRSEEIGFVVGLLGVFLGGGIFVVRCGRGLLRLILSEVLVLVGVGVAAGVFAALALGRLVESQLFGVKANDPLVMLVAVGVILAVTALAGYLPARRATGIDPMNALRYE